MSDYNTGVLATAAKVGTPMLAVRKDTPAADPAVGANLELSRLNVDSAGSLRISQEGGKATYFATSQFAADSTGTNIAIFAGAAGVTAKLLKIFLSTTATGAATGDVSIVRQSAADTAGTAVAASLGQADTRDAAPSVGPTHYTAHPTGLGTAVGTIFGQRCVQQAAGTPPATLLTFDFVNMFGAKALRVSGTTDIIAINVPAALTSTGNHWDITWVWEEEPTTA